MSEAKRQPLNLLLIVIDGLRADHVSAYGYARATTPVIDGLAREGVRATQAYASAPSTLPAHASLFTGLYAVTHGATSEHPMLSPAVPTLAGLAKAAGYRTAAFCTHSEVSVETGLGRGFDAFYTQRYRSRLATRAAHLGRRAADRLLKRSDAGARRSVNALRRWVSEATQPYFAFVHFDDTRCTTELPPLYQHFFATPAHAGDAAAQRVDSYDAAIRYVDERIGDVVQFLSARGDLDRTLIVVTSDHGIHLGAKTRVDHGADLGHDALHIPLIARCPQIVPQGFVLDGLLQSIDVAPTMLALARLPYEAASLHGQAFIEEGRATMQRPFAFAERFRQEGASSEHALRSRALWTRREKFVWRSNEANEYFDLHEDPMERYNVIEAEAERADLLRRQMFDFLAGVEIFEAPTVTGQAVRAV